LAAVALAEAGRRGPDAAAHCPRLFFRALQFFAAPSRDVLCLRESLADERRVHEGAVLEQNERASPAWHELEPHVTSNHNSLETLLRFTPEERVWREPAAKPRRLDAREADAAVAGDGDRLTVDYGGDHHDLRSHDRLKCCCCRNPGQAHSTQNLHTQTLLQSLSVTVKMLQQSARRKR